MSNDGHVTNISGMVHELTDLVKLLVWSKHVWSSFVLVAIFAYLFDGEAARIYVSKCTQINIAELPSNRGRYEVKNIAIRLPAHFPNGSRIV